jgi:chemotaxis protein CheX
MSINDQILTQLKVSEIQLLGYLNGDVREIFSTMVGMDVSLCSTMPESYSKFENCVSAMICLSGSFLGAVSVHAPPLVAMEITSQMLGMEIDTVDADVTDALGEIANMIAGSFKHHIVKDGHEMRITPPTVIARNEHFRPPGSSPDMLALLFEAGKDHFLVTVNLEVWD